LSSTATLSTWRASICAPINHGALDDPRVTVHIQDGARYLADCVNSVLH